MKRRPPTHRPVQSLFIAFALSAASAGSLAGEPPVVAPREAVAGIPQEAWSRSWWQWAGSFDLENSPVADKTGEFCHLKQSGPVWFLAGTYGTRRTVRQCTVPRGKHLFFPLINYVAMPPATHPVGCDAVKEAAEALTDEATGLLLEIDGVRVPGLAGHRLATGTCFDMGERATPRLRIYPSAGNGYYVMLKPLPPGRQTLNFGGALPGMSQAVTYTIQVD